MTPTTVVLVVVACLILQAAESKDDIFSKPAERVARSIQPRQSSVFGRRNCTQRQLDNIYYGYPSECLSVVRNSGSVPLTNARAVRNYYSTLCLPQCTHALARYYFECGFEALGELFIQLCSTNANNQHCYNLIGTLDTDTTKVRTYCPTGGFSCSRNCLSSILTYRHNAGCCVNIFNTSNVFNTPLLSKFVAADDYSLWASCSVETPGFCTQSTVIRPGSVPTTTSCSASGATSTHYPLSKLLAGLLLGVVMVVML